MTKGVSILNLIGDTIMGIPSRRGEEPQLFQYGWLRWYSSPSMRWSQAWWSALRRAGADLERITYSRMHIFSLRYFSETNEGKMDGAHHGVRNNCLGYYLRWNHDLRLPHADAKSLPLVKCEQIGDRTHTNWISDLCYANKLDESTARQGIHFCGVRI